MSLAVNAQLPSTLMSFVQMRCQFVSIDPAVAMMGPDAASLMVTLLPSGPVATASRAGASYAVGGQMIVTAGTPPGSYAGQYNISFEYQ